MYELSKDIIQYAQSLTFLALQYLKLDQQTMSILALKCPLLKSLELWFCDFNDRRVKVSGFQKLINLSVIANPMPRGIHFKAEIIDAPSLVKFRFTGCHASCPMSSSIDVYSACNGLIHMDLTKVWFDQRSLNRVLSHLPKLQHLNLSCHCLCPLRLDICSPSLKHLELRLQKFLKELHVDAPNLTNFVFALNTLYPLPIIFPLNADSFKSKKVTIDVWSGNTSFENFLQLVQFNRFYRQLDEASRHLMTRITIHDPVSLPCFRGLQSSVYDFKHVVLIIEVRDLCLSLFEPARSHVLFTNFLDPALNIFPNLQTCIISEQNFRSELMELKLEFKYKDSEAHDCWQQRLQEVKIEINQGFTMYLTPLRNYFNEAMKANKMIV